MAENSKISWTTHTFNPWEGCTKIHAGCVNCYAESERDHRYGTVKWGPLGTRKKTSQQNWKMPLRWNAEVERLRMLAKLIAGPETWCTADIAAFFGWPHNKTQEMLMRLTDLGVIEPNRGNLGGYIRTDVSLEKPKVFCASLSDVFEEWAGPIVDHHGEQLFTINGGDYFTEPSYPECRPATMDDLRRDLGKLIRECKCLVWLLLTKRPENAFRMMREMDIVGAPNLWLGTSISDQVTADEWTGRLLGCRGFAPVLFLSAEPLLGPIDFDDVPVPVFSFAAYQECSTKTGVVQVPGIDWVIIGGESGDKARPCAEEWEESIIKQCRAAGVPVFRKQAGSLALRNGQRVKYRDRKGGDPAEWPESLRVQESPKAFIL